MYRHSVLYRWIFPVLICTFIAGCSARDGMVPSPDVITWWVPNRAEEFARSMDRLPTFRALQDATEIALCFIHPPSGEHSQRFGSMLARGDLPDIISHDFVTDYPGGVQKALDDGVIRPLNQLIKRDAPNFSRFLAENPEVRELVTTSDGSIFCFPSLQTDRAIRTYMGPFARGDIFEALAIQAPRTIDEWTTTLAALHESPLVDVPLTFYGGSIRRTDIFIGAFDVGWGFYRNDRTVVYGALEPGFEEFLAVMAQWFDRGFIDAGFSVNSAARYSHRSTTRTVGIYVDYVSSMERYRTNLRKRDPEARFIPLRYPARDSGEMAEFGHLAPVLVPFASAYVTPTSGDPERAIRLLDFFYSPEGVRVFNFGIEGVSYELVDDQPVFRETLKTAPEGFTTALRRFVVAGPYRKDPAQFTQSLVLPEQRRAVELWSRTKAEDHRLPFFYPSSELSAELEGIMGRVQPYEEDMVVRFITGDVPIAYVEDFQDTLRRMGIERAIEIMQISLDARESGGSP